ncbi:MAG: phage portal protein [Magnetococcales bacterium]|nr:phage portal protein [Magnetococcales bacterium]
MMNSFERVLAVIAPGWALNRLKASFALRLYDAAQPEGVRRKRNDRGSGDAVMAQAGDKLRIQARYLDENHDLVVGILDTLVNRTVGAGLMPEPQARKKDGSLHDDYNSFALDLFQDWSLHPEVTGELTYPMVQRLAARSLFRDGEILAQHLEGNVKNLDHKTRVPYSIELIEADLLPFDFNDQGKGIVQGVEISVWGTPNAYHLLKSHPGDVFFQRKHDVKRVLSESIVHLKHVKRLKQTRGVTILAPVLGRLEDIKDYEESERKAAKIAAALAGYVKRTSDYTGTGKSPFAKGNGLGGVAGGTHRDVSIRPGTMVDNLAVGEEIETFKSNRPNSGLQAFRDSQLRAVAAGTGTTFSAIAKDYNGNYSSRRQEASESKEPAKAATGHFVGQFDQRIYQRFIRTAVLSGALKVPKDIDLQTIYDAEYFPPAMPEIDPNKEANSRGKNIDIGVKSQTQSIREAGGNPRKVLNQIEQERKDHKKRGLKFSTTPEDNEEKKPKKKKRKKKKRKKKVKN